jgi:hypothetical protein
VHWKLLICGRALWRHIRDGVWNEHSQNRSEAARKSPFFEESRVNEELLALMDSDAEIRWRVGRARG